MKLVFFVLLFIFGTVFGSFVCCQARRARLLEIKKKKLGNRSVCLKCGYKLKWYDNVPIVSWIVLGGRCRQCGKKIGALEILSEVLMGMAFLVIGISLGDFMEFSRIDWCYFMVLLCFVVVLGFLAIYDGKWGRLPQNTLFLAVIIGALLCFIRQLQLYEDFGSLDFLKNSLLSVFGGVGILAGIYFLLYFFSREKLVGGGDWILGLAISLSLGDWWLSLIVMFLSNLLAAIVMILMLKTKKNRMIYFGPWLICAFVLVFVFREYFLSFLIF